VTKESDKHRAVHFRWACSTRFRVAVTTFADNSRQVSPWAAAVYADATPAHGRPPSTPTPPLDPQARAI